MKFVPTSIAGVFEVHHDVRSDTRGRFRRQYCEREFATVGLNTSWVQMNHSVTLGSGSIRGLHFQRPPYAETKLVSCPVGRAFDVAVDLRRDSGTFLRWAAVEIDETTSFYIPEGCAHGFQALAGEVHLSIALTMRRMRKAGPGSTIPRSESNGRYRLDRSRTGIAHSR